MPWLSACSVGSPRYRGKVRRQEGAEGFTPKSGPLGHVWHVLKRDKEQHIWHFYPFLLFSNYCFSCKTVIIETFQPVSVPSSKGYCAIQYHRRSGVTFFLNSGDQTSPSFLKIPFKGVVMEPELRKKHHPQPWLLSTGDVPLCFRWGCRQTFRRSFPSLVGLSLSLTDAGILLVPPRFYHQGGVGMHQG